MALKEPLEVVRRYRFDYVLGQLRAVGKCGDGLNDPLVAIAIVPQVSLPAMRVAGYFA